MIPWEYWSTHGIFHNYKTVIFLILICLCIHPSHSRPIFQRREPLVSPQHNNGNSNDNNNASMVVRVIVSSSSSSSSSSSAGTGAGDSNSKIGVGYFPLREFKSTTRPSINPTTYHPDLTLPPISRSVRAKTSLVSEDNIFSLFYRAFSESGDKTPPISPFPATSPPSSGNSSVNSKVVSVVSHSRSVSSRGENPLIQPKAEPLTQNPEDYQEKIWGQPEENWGTPERNWGQPPKSDMTGDGEESRDWGDSLKVRNIESRKMWGQPERMWGQPERIWGKPEMDWSPSSAWAKRGQGQDDPTSSMSSPRIYEFPSMTDTKTSTDSPESEDTEAAGKFYELGEDEEAEPQELIIKESEVKAKVEEAQLASRSWELPELNSPVDHSLVSGVEMMAESIQVLQTQNVNLNSNIVRQEQQQRPTGSKALQDQNPPDPPEKNKNASERPGKKFGYVLDSSDVRKYRVEERTPDGYIVGEYGIINHDNGFLRGVRYTADGTINPRLIHEALMKFLAL